MSRQRRRRRVAEDPKASGRRRGRNNALRHTQLTHDTPHADAAVPELPVPLRFRAASRTPRSSTTNVAEPTALALLFASAADRFPDASRCSISLSSQAWDQASPNAGPGLSEVKLEANWFETTTATPPRATLDKSKASFAMMRMRSPGSPSKVRRCAATLSTTNSLRS